MTSTADRKSIHVAVLLGGWSAEREVSLSSGNGCANALEAEGFRVTRVDVDRGLARTLTQLKPDVCFNALHGRWGEDGCVQGLLEVLGIPYTHSGVLASSAAMNKEQTRRIVARLGIPVAEGLIVTREAALADHAMAPPYVAKPVAEGSSVGVVIVSAGANRPPEAIAQAVLAHDPLAVALVILHIEWMTQRHYLDSVKYDQSLDPQFKSLLKHHWMEEAQHAKLDTLMVEAIAAKATPEEIEAGVADYLKIGMLIDGGLEAQTKFDLAAFERATGRKLTMRENLEAHAVQRQANRWTYLGSGMTHPNFLATLGTISPDGRKQVEGVAPAFR